MNGIEHEGRIYEAVTPRANAVVIVACPTPAEIILIKQYRPVVGQMMYELPAGVIDPGEKPEETALRELREETGYVGARAHQLTTFYSSAGYSTELIYLMVVLEMEPGEQQLEPNETIEVVRMPIFKAVWLLDQNQIKESKAIIGINWAREWLKKRVEDEL